MSKSKKTGEGIIDFGKMDIGKRLRIAAKALMGLKEVSLASGNVDRPDEVGFRRITQRSDKELTPSSWQKQMDVAHFLWLQNPMAHRILELQADFVVGDGFTFQAADEEVGKILDRHWKDPDNAWDMKQYERYIELTLFGIWAPKVFVNKHNGHVKISPVDPAWIVDMKQNIDNPGKVDNIKLSRGQGGKIDWLEVVKAVQDPKDENFGLLCGEIFYFPINKLSFTVQGTSDLFRIADWLDAYDQFIFSLLERINFLNAHLYDITIEGAEQKDVQEKIQDLEDNPPKPGGFRVHNEKEKWEALAPKINAAEVDDVARLVRILILGAAGIPEHWFSVGGDVNKATASEMAGPILRKMKRKQAFWRDVVTEILQFQIDQAIKVGRLSTVKMDDTGKMVERDMSFQVIVPDLSAKDVALFADTLIKLTTALVDAVDAGFMELKKAREIFASAASESGIEVDPITEEKAAEEKADQEAAIDKKVEELKAEALGKDTPSVPEPAKPTPEEDHVPASP